MPSSALAAVSIATDDSIGDHGTEQAMADGWFIKPGASSPWVSSNGVVAHLDSPLGGGGPGHFVGARSLGLEGNNSDPIPHPQSPAARYRLLTGDDVERLVQEGVPLDVKNPSQPPGTVPIQPPPATQTSTFKIQRSTAGKENIDVEVQVLADGSDTKPGRDWSAHTVVDPSGAKQAFPERFIDEADAKKPTDQQKVLELKGVYSITGKVTIQVRYGSQAKPTHLAAYGRGTTDDDKSKGTRTVGFHESCHLADFVSWLKTKPLPKFNGAVGMTVKKYEEECDASEAAFEKYFADAEADSIGKTDDVGSPTLTEYKKTHPGYKH
jgi:hypothetical protein